MQLEIITEREASPFRHIFPKLAENSNGRRYARDPESAIAVMGEFLDSLGLSRDIRTLEIGGGDFPIPSYALYKLGATAYVLEADWNKFCNEIPEVEDLKKLGEAQLYPMLAGRREEMTHYLGDMAFIGDERSQLRDERFGLVFNWGCVAGGFCSSIAQSRTASREFGIEIPLQDRLVAPIGNVEDGGYMASVSGFVNGIGDPTPTPEFIPSNNGLHIGIVLTWANYAGREPKKIIVYGLTPDFAFDYVRQNRKDSTWMIAHENEASEDEIREAVECDPIQRSKEKYSSIFSDPEKNDNSRYEKALEVLTGEQQKKLSDLGIIDCVVAQY